MANHLVLYLATRSLKICEKMASHEIEFNSKLLTALEQVKQNTGVVYLENEERSDQGTLGDAFALLRDRVQTVDAEVRLQELKREMSEDAMLGADRTMTAE